jgi:hypothetical protein
MSCIYGENRDVCFPKLSEKLHLISFADIAVEFLKELGYEHYLCNSENEARELISILLPQKKWPCLFTTSDTTGEKDFEEFYTEKEKLDMESFKNFGIIKNPLNKYDANIELFSSSINGMKQSNKWSKKELIDLFCKIIPDFKHKETGKYLDSKM